ncbi:MAG: DNA polymerase III subunit delta [Planctomycetaceae bacterium]|nr:DNA polymerase III subunit delta [Planctomycetaceae bacterium]
MHAVDYLKSPGKHGVRPVVVLHGEEWQLKQSALRAIVRAVLGGDADDDLSVSRFPGKVAEWRSVRDELLTVSMFASSRVAVVEDADDFITKYRESLEEYADKPSNSSVLVLDAKSWRKNTRLAKKVAASGWEIDCSELSGGQLTKWLIDRAQDEHGKQLARDAAVLMTELVGSSLGLLEQELGKLSAYAGERAQITAEDVRGLVGGWKAETTWVMTNAVRDGQVGVALKCLDQLLTAGEAPQKLLGGLNYVFRKYAQAAERSRSGTPLNIVLKDCGVFPRDMDGAVRYLRRIGRPRAERILSRLVQADADLKGASRTPDRLQMERLLLDLAGTTGGEPAT